MRNILSFLLLAGVFLATAGPAAAYTFESVGIYQSFDEMTAWAAAFEAANPDIVSVVEFGRSHEDRPLLAIQISATPGQNDPDKPEFLFTGGVHAREVIGSEATYRLAEHLVGAYHANSAAAIDILAEREVWIVPTLNPDGRVFVEAGYSQQRKTMQWFPGQSTNPALIQHGIDLNRNFPHRWSDASNVPRQETYRGPDNPLSAPEAGALWDLLHDESYFSDMLAAIDFHSGAHVLLTPWISPLDFQQNPLPQEDREKFDFLADTISQLTWTPSERLGYESYGTLTDSLYEEFGAYAICQELYQGMTIDYFSLFNPVNEFIRDWTIDRAIDSSMFMLSDQAFSITPEPASWLLMLFGMMWLFSLRQRPRIL